MGPEHTHVAEPSSPGVSARPVGGSNRWALGALLAAAGIVHLVMAPSHLADSAVEGTGFLVAGWAQLALSAGIVLRPTRWLLAGTVGLSVALIGAWMVSRTLGLPFGHHAGHPAEIAVVDLTTVGLEAAAVVLAASLLAGSGLLPTRGAAALAVPVVVVALTTLAIASPSARDHAAGSHGDHQPHGPGVAHGAGGEHAGEHVHDEHDDGLSELVNGHNHHGEPGEAEWVPLDPATQAELAAQLALTMELVARYPTVADAQAAGYFRAGPFAPGLGTHYTSPTPHLNTDGVMSPEDIANPVLIYDGSEPTSRLAGFMYMAYGDTEPEGFAGPNDRWHYHTNVCIKPRPEGGIDTPFGADLDDVTAEMCAEVGGAFIDFTGYMLHVWTVPGYENEYGVFADVNPKLTCPDGTYHRIPTEELGTRDTVCRG